MTISIYRFFQRHKILFYAILLLSFAFLAYFGSRVTYEEDISKLLPASDDAETVGLAFADLKVKDKIFVQFTAKDSTQTVDEYTLSDACDLFVEKIQEIDAQEGDVDEDILYQIDDYTLMSAVGFLFDHVPSFVDSTAYEKMDTLFSPANIAAQMKQNYALLSDENGASMGELISHDPVGLRNVLLAGGLQGAAGGFSILNQHLFTPDSTVALAFLSPNFKSLDSGSGTRLANKMEAAIDSVVAVYPQVEVLFHGAPIESVNNSRRIKKDLMLTMGTSLLIICLLIGICFRNKSTLPLLLLPVVFGALFALTGIYFVQGGMSLMALGLGAIVLGVALSYCLHVLTHYKYVSDPERVLHEQTKPVIMGSLTTIGAFAGLLFTQSALLRDFGLFALLAIVGTTLACLIFLPHFFTPERNRRSMRAFAWIEHVNSIQFDRKNWLLISIGCISIVCIMFSGHVNFDSNLKNIGYHADNTVRSQKLLASKTAPGLKSQYYAVASSNLDSALAFNAELTSTCSSLREAGVVTGYSKTGTLFVDNETQQKRIADWKAYFTPARCATIRNTVVSEGQKAGFAPDAFAPFLAMLQTDFEPASLYDAEILPASLLSNFVEKSGDTYLVFTSVQMPPENLQNVNDILAKKGHTLVVDPFYYTGNMVQLLHNDFNKILGISSLFVFLVLLLAFRNVFIAIIAFLPMGLSWYIVLGTMGILGVQFNLINIIISTFIFGIGVDYSIFVMDGLLANARGKDTHLLLYHKTAILLSAFVLIICMASLLFAVHPAISSIGFAALVGMISTLLITYSVQPFLFNLLVQTKFGKRVIMHCKD